MPLDKSNSKAAVSRNIETLLGEGKPRKQAIAIALDIKKRASKASGGSVDYSPTTQAFRNILGQGTLFGWGDEGEAWLRSKLGKGSYEDNVAEIRAKNEAYAKNNPIVSTIGEIGGALPTMLIPGLGAVRAGKIAGAGLKAINNPYARAAGVGAAEGAVAGAGYSKEGQRLEGAIVGGVLGAPAGAAGYGAIKAGGAGIRKLKDKRNEGRIRKAAAQVPDDSAYDPLRARLKQEYPGMTVHAERAPTKTPSSDTPPYQRKVSPVGLYSYGEEATSRLPQAKGQPQQFAAMLKKAGVKDDELNEADFMRYFEGRPSITRKEVGEYFQSRAPEVREVVRMELDSPILTPEALYPDSTLLGGENYREIELLLPSRTSDAATNAARYDELNNIAARRNLTDVESDEMLAIEQAEFGGESGSAGEDFVQGHFPEKNLLAHLRMTDRINRKTDKKSLHIEEIQSDWGQTGKRSGFKDLERNYAEDLEKLRKQIKEHEKSNPKATKEWYARRDYFNYKGIEWDADKSMLNDWEKQREKMGRELSAIDKILDRGVPAAPFVTETSKWTDLALKRALFEAAKGDYEKITFSPGKDIALRSGQRTFPSIMQWNPLTKKLTVYDVDSQLPMGKFEPFYKETVPKEKLASIVGEERAKKLIKKSRNITSPQKARGKPITQEIKDFGNAKKTLNAPPFTVSLEGKDLLVGGKLEFFGGHGNIEYYDVIMPQRLKKLLKKLDPKARIGREKFKGTEDGEVLSVTMTPKMREKILEGLPMFGTGGLVKPFIQPVLKLARDIADREGMSLADLVDRYLFKDVDRAAAHMKAEARRKKEELQKFTEIAPEGKIIKATQADRTSPALGGGPSFSIMGIDLPDFKTERIPTWAVMDKGAASRILGQTSDDVVWTTALGSPEQLFSNKKVFGKIKNSFFKNIDNLNSELEGKLNKNIKNLAEIDKAFRDADDKPFKITDKALWNKANKGSFPMRRVIADLVTKGDSKEYKNKGFTPITMGGKRKLQKVVDWNEIVETYTDSDLYTPPLTPKQKDIYKKTGRLEGIKVRPTYAAGNRLFTVDNTPPLYRPDIHPAFPTILTGRSLAGKFEPVPHQHMFRDWHSRLPPEKQIDASKWGMNVTRGIPGEGLPSQFIDDKFLRFLQDKGYKEGGQPKKKKTLQDLIQIYGSVYSVPQEKLKQEFLNKMYEARKRKEPVRFVRGRDTETKQVLSPFSWGVKGFLPKNLHAAVKGHDRTLDEIRGGYTDDKNELELAYNLLTNSPRVKYKRNLNKNTSMGVEYSPNFVGARFNKRF